MTAIDLSQRPFRITVGKTEYFTDALILATGASAKWLDLGVDKQLSGRGVSTCATCDGFFFKGRDVAVVGGGDTAMEEAIYLSKLATTVTVIHRRDTLRASKVMQDKARSLANIRFIWNTEVIDIKDVGAGRGHRARAEEPADRRGERAAGRRRVHRHRPHPEHEAGRGAARRSTRTATS